MVFEKVSSNVQAKHQHQMGKLGRDPPKKKNRHSHIYHSHAYKYNDVHSPRLCVSTSGSNGGNRMHVVAYVDASSYKLQS